ncbi:MAG: hypothetical protein DRZ80_08410 [Thermoprotei archaeon]|nr:MAG: hypothetical protein DRZ80_08410 [Thermoprotei archaeon]
MLKVVSLKISVIVATKNCQEHISDLMDSLAKIVDEDVQVLIIDSSTDETPEIASKYDFAEVIKFDKPGLNAARNYGVKRADGDIVIFTDCDCIVPKNWIKNILKVFEEENADVVGGSAKNFFEEVYLVTDYANEGIWPVMPVYKERIILTRENFRNVRLPPGNNLAFKKAIFERGYFFDEEYKYGCDEIDLLWRLCRDNFKIVVDPDVYVYHKHRTSLKELLRQEFRYGMGHYLFFVKNRDCPISWPAAVGSYFFTLFFTLLGFSYFIFQPLFVSLSVFTLTTLAEVYTILFIYYFKKRKLKLKKCLLYPLLDVACHISYLLGFLNASIRERIACRER